MKYFVIGDEDTVLGFSLVGVEGSAAKTAPEADNAFENALKDANIGIIVITDEVADLIRDKVNSYLFSEAFPLIVEIPSPHGSGHSKDLHKFVNEAIGVSL